MTRGARAIDTNPAVRAVAARFGIAQTIGLRQAIASAAVRRVEGWMRDCNFEPQSLSEVQRLILNQTRIKIERINSNADLASVIERYEPELPVLPKQLELEFGGNTEALVFRPRLAKPSASMIAVVDARGERRQRAWFAERHEPSHIIIPDKNAQAVWRRTTADRPSPLEQVVDAVASEIGFWSPLVAPALLDAQKRHTHVLDAFEASRSLLAPDASFESAYRAFARLVRHPMLVIYSRRVTRRDGSGLALRAVTVIANDAAERTGLQLWQNYRIPPDSVITQAIDDPFERVIAEHDDLGRWPSSTGPGLSQRRVLVTARGRWATIEAAD